MKHYSTLIKEVFISNSKEPETNSFVNRMSDMTRVYQRIMKAGDDILITKFGKEKGCEIIEDIEEIFFNLIPEMPSIRQDDPFLERQLIISTFYLAAYKALSANNTDLKEINQLCEKIIVNMLNSISYLTRILTRKRMFSKDETIRMKKSAEISQERKYPDDYVFEFIPGKDINHYEYVIKECAVCKFYKKHNAEEFIPAICNLNKIFSNFFDYELVQTTFLSKGDDNCKISYSKENC